ncbi:MAG: glycosyltransferase [Azospirillaceae bacterium]|nr:glycosyltransferase [Azospirillaceae bacterium]
MMDTDPFAGLLARIDAALANRDQQAAVALARQAVPTTGAGQSALRKLVHALMGLGQFDEAALQAGRLVRLPTPLPDDLVLDGIVALHRQLLPQAQASFVRALDLDRAHPLAAAGLWRAWAPAVPDPSLLRRLVSALAWNAETNDDCRSALAALVAAGQCPVVVFPLYGRVGGYAAPRNDGVVSLVWNGLVLGRRSLRPAPSDAGGVVALDFPVPTALAGHADLHVLVDGIPVPGSPIAAEWTRAPRLVAEIVETVETGGRKWSVRARDAATPGRPVAVCLDDGAGWTRRLVFRPGPDSAPADLHAVSPQQVSMGPAAARPVFPGTGEPVPLSRPPSATMVTGAIRWRPIDIIVPIYGDAVATAACLKALRGSMAATAGLRFEVILIADGPADADVTALVDAVESEGWATVLRNAGNLGFVRTVNRGMALHPDRDVVLLNADTEVHGDWLRRLAAAAYSGDDVGTVTPLSNDATILSYPDPQGTNLAAVSVPLLDDLAATTLAGRTADLPTGIGFCFYVRRDCLDEIGYFDSETFGQGYGEENDFCCRAAEGGWRNIGALDVLVGHIGGSSFGPSKAARIAAALDLLDRRHPDYQAQVHAFIAADPLASARRALDLAWLKLSGPRPSLVVCPKLGGGTDRFVDQQVAALTAQGIRVLLLRPEGTAAAPRLRLEAPDVPLLRSVIYDADTGLADLIRDLRSLGVERVILHHVIRATDATLVALADHWPYDVHVHDYVWICPRIDLIDGNGRYCGEPAVTVCETCIRANGHRLRPGLSAAAWRRFASDLLAGARRVVCPSQDTARRMATYVPQARMVVEAHPETPSAPPTPVAGDSSSVTRIAIVGAIGRSKGYEVLLSCARDAAARDLALEFRLIGYSQDDQPLLETGRVLLTGQYAEGEVAALLQAANCHLGLLPSVWPETWCYTLSRMLDGGLTIAAFDLGAQAERLRARGAGMLMPLGTTAPRINDALLELARRKRLASAAPPVIG